MSALHEAAEAALLLDDRRVIQDAAAARWPFGGRLSVAGRATSCYGPVDLIVGRLAARLGRDREAGERLGAARELARRTELRPVVAAADAALAGAAAAAR